MHDEATVRRFWAMVDRRGPDECWPWTGYFRGQGGYGGFRWAGRDSTAHRFAWELANGKEIPAGMLVRHSCDNPPCCNARHLLIGTPADNAGDRSERKRQARGVQHGRAVLSEQDVDQIRLLIANEMPVGKIARLFGVSQGNISEIKTGRTWAWYTSPDRGR